MFLSVTRPYKKSTFYSKVTNEKEAESLIKDIASEAIENKMNVRMVYSKGKILGIVVDESIIYRIEMEWRK